MNEEQKPHKTWTMLKKANFTSLEFPSDLPTLNLTFALDGLYNVKGGHSNKATQWLDLATGEYSDFPVNPDNWTDRGYRLTGDTFYSLRKYLKDSSMKHIVHVVFEELDETSYGSILSYRTVNKNNNPPVSFVPTIASTGGMREKPGYTGLNPKGLISLPGTEIYTNVSYARSIMLFMSKSKPYSSAKYPYRCYVSTYTDGSNRLTYDPGASFDSSYSASNPTDVCLGHQVSGKNALTSMGKEYATNIVINAIRIYSGNTLPDEYATLSESYKHLLNRFPNR